MRKVLAVVPDLMFRSKIAAAATATGASLATCAAAALAERAAADPPELVLVDLNVKPDDACRAVAALRQAGSAVRVLGFVGHVREDVRDRALAAGVDEVLANGALVGRLPALFVG